MSRVGLQPGQMILGRYRIEGLLGEGGMGSVYRATQVSVGRTVAVKVIAEALCKDPKLVERFEREGHALARLKHHHTVSLFDFGATEQGQPFIVMELLEGCDLADKLAQHGTLGWVDALQICGQVLRSLEEAHGVGVLHRDIKPANLFLCSQRGQQHFVKVLDFGISGMAAENAPATRLTATGLVVGSIAYMSPEQAEGRSTGPATDLYSVGVVLFEMLTGRTLFDAQTLPALLLAKVSQPPPSVRAVCPEIELPEVVQSLLNQLLELDPTQRPRSAGVVAEHIETILRGCGAVGAKPAVARTEPMASRGARARTGASPRSNPSAAGAQRSLYLFGVTALAPVALLCAFAAREMLYSHPPVAPIPEGTHVAPPAPPIDPDPRKQPAEPVQPAPASGEPASPIAPKPSAGGGALKQRDEELPPEPAASGTELGQPGAPDPLLARYATIAEAISARDAGKISTQQMNRIVRPLRRREEDELRRVGSEYKAGNIALQALQAEQAAIRHQYEGPQ